MRSRLHWVQKCFADRLRRVRSERPPALPLEAGKASRTRHSRPQRQRGRHAIQPGEKSRGEQRVDGKSHHGQHCHSGHGHFFYGHSGDSPACRRRWSQGLKATRKAEMRNAQTTIEEAKPGLSKREPSNWKPHAEKSRGKNEERHSFNELRDFSRCPAQSAGHGPDRRQRRMARRSQSEYR